MSTLMHVRREPIETEEPTGGPYRGAPTTMKIRIHIELTRDEVVEMLQSWLATNHPELSVDSIAPVSLDVRVRQTDAYDMDPFGPTGALSVAYTLEER